MLQQTVLSQTHDYVVVAGVRCLKADYATLEQDFTQITQEARNWVGGSASS